MDVESRIANARSLYEQVGLLSNSGQISGLTYPNGSQTLAGSTPSVSATQLEQVADGKLMGRFKIGIDNETVRQDLGESS